MTAPSWHLCRWVGENAEIVLFAPETSQVFHWNPQTFKTQQRSFGCILAYAGLSQIVVTLCMFTVCCGSGFIRVKHFIYRLIWSRNTHESSTYLHTYIQSTHFEHHYLLTHSKHEVHSLISTLFVEGDSIW